MPKDVVEQRIGHPYGSHCWSPTNTRMCRGLVQFHPADNSLIVFRPGAAETVISTQHRWTEPQSLCIFGLQSNWDDHSPKVTNPQTRFVCLQRPVRDWGTEGELCAFDPPKWVIRPKGAPRGTTTLWKQMNRLGSLLIRPLFPQPVQLPPGRSSRDRSDHKSSKECL